MKSWRRERKAKCERWVHTFLNVWVGREKENPGSWRIYINGQRSITIYRTARLARSAALFHVPVLYRGVGIVEILAEPTK